MIGVGWPLAYPRRLQRLVDIDELDHLQRSAHGTTATEDFPRRRGEVRNKGTMFTSSFRILSPQLRQLERIRHFADISDRPSLHNCLLIGWLRVGGGIGPLFSQPTSCEPLSCRRKISGMAVGMLGDGLDAPTPWRVSGGGPAFQQCHDEHQLPRSSRGWGLPAGPMVERGAAERRSPI